MEVIEFDGLNNSNIREAHTDGDNLYFVRSGMLYKIDPTLKLEIFSLPDSINYFSIRSLSNHFTVNKFGQIAINGKRDSEFVTVYTNDDFETYTESLTPVGELHYFGKDTLVSFSGLCSDLGFPNTSYSYNNGQDYILSNFSLCPYIGDSKAVIVNDEIHLFGSAIATNDFSGNSDCSTNIRFSPRNLTGGISELPNITEGGRCHWMNSYILSNGMKFILYEAFNDTTINEVPLYVGDTPTTMPTVIGTAPSGSIFVDPITKEQFVVNNTFQNSVIFHRRNFQEEFQEILISESLGNINNIEFIDNGGLFLIGLNRIFYSNGVDELSNRIIGDYYYDLNSDCTYDSADVFVKNEKLFYSTNGNDELLQFVNDGSFNIGVEEGITIFNTPVDESIWEICPDDKEVIVDIDSIEQHNIALTPVRNCNHVTISYGATPLIRCFNSKIEMHVQNEGTIAAEDLIIELQLDPNLIITNSNYSYISNSDLFEFDIGSLQPLEKITLTLEILISCDSELEDILCLTTQVRDNGESCYPNEIMNYCDKVIGSYDPNDISAFNNSILPDTIFEKNESIIYRIRFQNTGTAEAFNVRLENPINERLLLNSVKVLSSSHNYNLIVENNKLIFYFDNINLQSSEVDSLNSQGYITYKIRLSPEVDYGERIQNDASIFFDFNAPIHTNIAKVIIDMKSSIGSGQERKVIVSPNPTTGLLYVNDNIDLFSHYRIYTSDGKILNSGILYSDEIDLNNIQYVGLVFVELYNENGIRKISKVLLIE